MEIPRGYKTNDRKLHSLGAFYSRIVGVQYYENSYSVGEQLYFERNPYNEYDDNAIEIQNDKGVIGHLKRTQTTWLASLLDKGEIYLKGTIADEGDDWRVPIRVEVYLTTKGKHILKIYENKSPEQIIHNHILNIYNNADKYSEDTLSGIRDYYRGMTKMDAILPETRLIFKLLKNKIEDSRKNNLYDFIDQARTYCERIKYAKPLQYENITVIPLLIDNPESPRYVSGKKALKNGTLVIEEIDSDGEVSRLRATNKGNKPVMLISGEGLKGAKQDRIVNVTVIIAVNATVDIPVSCVERGRWSYEDNKAEETKFKSSNIATQDIRFSIQSDINKDIVAGKESYESDQDLVWHKVSETAYDLCIDSETENLNEVYQANETDLDAIASEMKYVKNAIGMAIFSGRKKLSVDLFSQPGLMKDNWDDLIRSAVIEIKRTRKPKGKDKRSEKEFSTEITAFFDKVFSETSEPEKNPGTGRYIVSRNNQLEAGTLVEGTKIAHLSGFYQIN